MNTFLYLQQYSRPSDYFMKSLQNFSYLLSYIFRNNKKLKNKTIHLGNIILDSRRTMSFFSFVDSMYGLKQNINQNNITTKKLNRNVYLSSLIENIFENIDFLIGKNIIKGNQKLFTRTFCALWVGNISTILMRNCFELKQINENKEIKDDEKKEAQKMKIIEIGSYICDLPCAIAGTKLLPKLIGKNFNTGIIGLTGLIAGTSRYYLYFLRNKKNMNV